MLGMSAARSFGARSMILDAILSRSATTRSDIAESTDLTGATVSTTVRELIDDGLVEEVGTEEATRGKPRRILRLVRNSRYAVGVHLDDGVTRFVLANLAGDVVASVTDVGLGPSCPEELIGRIATQAGQMIADSGVPRELVLGIGVCAPGPIAPGTAMIVTPAHLKQWSDFPLAESLQNATGMPVVVDNDATACALGEYWTNSVDAQGLATLYMGTGLGGAAIIGGVPYRGTSGNSGEVGHICVDVDGPQCWCGNVGCIEIMGGPRTVVGKARELGLIEPEGSIIAGFKQLAGLAHEGDEGALALFEDSARYIALAAHALACILDPDHIALTGPSFAVAGDLYVPAIEDILRTRYLARRSHTIDILVSRHAEEAAGIGAAALIFQSTLLFGRMVGAATMTNVRTL